MRRDIKKAIAEGEALVGRNERLELTAFELNEIKELCQAGSVENTMFNLIVTAFHAGLAIGHRNSRRPSGGAEKLPEVHDNKLAESYTVALCQTVHNVFACDDVQPVIDEWERQIAKIAREGLEPAKAELLDKAGVAIGYRNGGKNNE